MKEKFLDNLNQIGQNTQGKVYFFYNQKYTNAFDKLKLDTELKNNILISKIPYIPCGETNFLILYNRIFIDQENKDINLNKDNVIVYFGEDEDKLLSELALRYYSTNKIFLINSSDYSLKELDNIVQNKVFYKRFNLIQKAKESEVFGIIVGSLSISGLNAVIEELKITLKSSKKKVYTFLLGKITLEKLSNFVEYIDCFILVACPFSSFYDFKTLMKPLVSPLDIKIAFDERYKWDLRYSYDTNYILNKGGNIIDNKIETLNTTQSSNIEHTSIKLQQSEKNQALANIFSIRTLESYDNKKYKGLEVKYEENKINKVIKGKVGIPIKYEDIK